jgi:FtsH-binding integral membrane protein
MYQEYADSPSLSVGARQNFVKKVYSVLSMQLAFTVFVVWCSFTFKAFQIFQRRNNWLFWVAFITTLVSLISLCKSEIM